MPLASPMKPAIAENPIGLTASGSGVIEATGAASVGSSEMGAVDSLGLTASVGLCICCTWQVLQEGKLALKE